MNKNKELTIPNNFLFQAHEHEIRETTPMQEAEKFLDAQLAGSPDEQATLMRIIEECKIAEQGDDPTVSKHESLVTTLRLAAEDRQEGGYVV